MVKGSDLSVDKKKCIGCGNCIVDFPDLFHFDKQGKSEPIKSGTCEDCDIKDVIDTCPQNAISKNKS